MTTTHTLTASAAIGLARKPATATKMAATPAAKPINRKKAVELGLLAGALGAAVVLTLKAATIFNAIFASMDAVYKSFSN
jgi:hypothetical protein